MVLKRDPALWLMLLATLLRLLSAFVFHFSVDQQALINTLLAAIFGVIVAFTVAHDGQVAAITGLFSAGIAAAVGFGLKLSPADQAIIMSFVGAAVSFYNRTQITARVGPVVTGATPTRTVQQV